MKSTFDEVCFLMLVVLNVKITKCLERATALLGRGGCQRKSMFLHLWLFRRHIHKKVQLNLWQTNTWGESEDFTGNREGGRLYQCKQYSLFSYLIWINTSMLDLRPYVLSKTQFFAFRLCLFVSFIHTFIRHGRWFVIFHLIHTCVDGKDCS